MNDTGSNINAELKRRADRRVKVLDDIGDLQEELKGFKAEDKSDGFTEKAIGQVVREMRSNAERRAKQIALEVEINAYRRAVGLPVTLEAAQAAARDAAEQVPDVKGGDL
jgi:uncharacterized protein (UPF0335 family)